MMRSVIIFPEEVKDIGIITESNKVSIENIDIHTGIIEEEALTLNQCSDSEYAVLVKKKAFSCNYRDKSFLLSYDKHIKDEALKGNYKFSCIGSEFVGEVIEVGAKVKGLSIGDRVIPNIAYPSYSENYRPGVATNLASSRIEDFDDNKLIKISNDYSHISDEVLAAFPIAGFTAYSMIRKVVQPNTKVLVTAARSNTSLAVINALKNFSVEVYAMTSNSTNLNALKQLGVTDVLVINHDLDNFVDDEIFKKKIEQIGGFDTVIDPFFDIYLPRVIDLINMDGNYITCGLFNQYQNFSNTKNEHKGESYNAIFVKAMIKNLTIIGNCIGLDEDGMKALEDLNTGAFDIIIDKVFSEGEEHLFLDRTFNAKDKFGKVVYKYK